MEFTLLWAVVTAFAAAYLTLRVRPISVPDRPLDRMIGAAVVGMVAGRVASLVAAGINLFLNPAQIVLVRGGVDTVWASLFATAALAWPLRHRLQGLDNLAPAVLAALAGWHAGCVFRSTCLGAASGLPWAFALPGSDITRHPVELYTAALLVAGVFLSYRLRPGTGAAAGLAVAWAALSRLVTQPLRPSLDGGPVWFYAAATVAGVGWVVWRMSTRAQPRVSSSSDSTT